MTTLLLFGRRMDTPTGERGVWLGERLAGLRVMVVELLQNRQEEARYAGARSSARRIALAFAGSFWWPSKQ